jgi:hypothetical protein
MSAVFSLDFLWGVPLALTPRYFNSWPPQVVLIASGFLPVAGCGGWVFRYPLREFVIFFEKSVTE